MRSYRRDFFAFFFFVVFSTADFFFADFFGVLAVFLTVFLAAFAFAALTARFAAGLRRFFFAIVIMGGIGVIRFAPTGSGTGTTTTSSSGFTGSGSSAFFAAPVADVAIPFTVSVNCSITVFFSSFMAASKIRG
jgi:hypothetical protein